MYVFVVQVDRLYEWKKCPNAPIIKALKQQNEDVKREFNMRLTQVHVHSILLSLPFRGHLFSSFKLKCMINCFWADHYRVQGAGVEYTTIL